MALGQDAGGEVAAEARRRKGPRRDWLFRPAAPVEIRKTLGGTQRLSASYAAKNIHALRSKQVLQHQVQNAQQEHHNGDLIDAVHHSDVDVGGT